MCCVAIFSATFLTFETKKKVLKGPEVVKEKKTNCGVSMGGYKGLHTKVYNGFWDVNWSLIFKNVSDSALIKYFANPFIGI